MNYTDKIYGKNKLTGVLEELINTNVFQRLKKIHQGGAIFLIKPEINQTRYDHSIGVMLLIQRLGGSLEEQIAGLIHDISHTAFSHLIDYVLEIEEEDYHEQRFEEVLRDKELVEVLQKNGLEWTSFLEMEIFSLLEYPLPYLCADRIDYTLRDLFQIGVITKKEIDWFLGGLLIFEKRIVLKSAEHGHWFQTKYNYLVSEYFEEAENKAVNIIMKKIVKDCMEKGIIEESDFFKDDFYLIDKLETSFNIRQRISEMKEEGIGGEKLKSKKRKIDPEILVGNQIMKLSEMS